MLIEFSLKLVYILPGVGRIFKFMVLTFLENALDLGIFTMSLLTLSSPPSSCQHTIARRKLLIPHPPGQLFFENMFPPTGEKGGGNYDLLYQDSIKKYEDDLSKLEVYQDGK